MHREPLISIVMPVYNTARYIEEAISSVLAQTYINWELIIVNDCSPDDAETIICQFEDRRIRYLKNDKNSGALETRNRAMKEAKGRYIAFLDSDDVWTRDKLQKQIRYMQDNNYYFTCTSYEYIDEESHRLYARARAPRRITRGAFMLWNWCGCLTVIYDVAKMGKVYLKDYKMRDDWALWIKLSKKSPCYFLDENLAMYRVREGSQTKSGTVNLLKQHYAIFRYSEQIGAIASFFMAVLTPFAYLYRKLRYVKKIP